MKLHSLKNTYKRPARKRVGRGNGNNWGGTCGRGHKGQHSRTGATRRPYFEGGQLPLLRRLPKRGFKNPNRKFHVVVNVSELEELFAPGETVDAAALKAHGRIDKLFNGLKILGNGELTKALTVKAVAFSASARAKIEAAGGTCEEVPLRAPRAEAEAAAETVAAAPAEEPPAETE